MTRLSKYARVSHYSVFWSLYCKWLDLTFMFKILQPPPAQTMVQALELLYALGGKKQSCQDGKVNRKTVLQLQDLCSKFCVGKHLEATVSSHLMQDLNQLRVCWQVWTITAV